MSGSQCGKGAGTERKGGFIAMSASCMLIPLMTASPVRRFRIL